ncbi:MAG: GNAT family N-acetyltransferase [Clostridia bacterium]|nr:GNAT family N-acetyltransferase [Clostridia bacterium]
MTGIEKKITYVALEKIQPTQLYILKEEYESYQYIKDEYDPIPVKRVGTLLFFLENHELALYLANNGHDEIKVYESDDNQVDIISYFTKIRWCHENNIFTIKDLSVYVLKEKEFQKKWIKRCEKLSDQLFKNPLMNVDYLKEITPSIKSEITNDILRSLPSWFGIEQSIIDYCEKVKTLEFIKIELFDMVIGFCAYKINYGINCDLVVLGIFEQFHRFGIGSKLIDFINNELKHNEVRYMSVKTLSENHSDENYKRTRNFYIKNGFYPFEEIKDLWGKENPCLIMIREVR